MANRTIEYPQRLLHGESIAGRLLRRSLDEPFAFPSESQCYHGLLERREPKRVSVRYWLKLAAVAGVTCSAVLFWFARRGHDAVRFTAHADHMVTTSAVGATVSPSAIAEPRRGSPVAPSLTPTALESKPSSKDDVGVPASARERLLDSVDRMPAEARVDDPKSLDNEEPHAPEQSGRDGRAPTSAPAASAPMGALDDDTAGCARLARGGKLEEASGCYDRIARGNGMASELALYEKARLESRALGRGAAALATLEEHARRFPHGVLATEAGFTRIELLSRLGRSAEALEAIEGALPGAMGRERGGDLHLLKGDLLSLRGECEGALSAYAAARAAGIHPNRLKAGEGRCARASEPTRPNPVGKSRDE